MIEKITGTATTISNISHIGEALGVDSKFARQEIFFRGRKIKIPFISANSVRGTMRRLAAKKLLETIGKQKSDYGGYVQYLLLSGGMLVKSKIAAQKGAQTGVIDFNFEKKVRRLIPYLSLMGCIVEQKNIEGRLLVSDMIPVACQTQYLTEIESDLNVNSVLSEVANTSKDDSEAEGETGLGDEGDKQKRQMRYYTEVMIPGTILKYNFSILPTATDLDRGSFNSIMRDFINEARLGGNKRIGYGEILFNDFKVDNELADGHDSYIDGLKNDITTFLEELDMRWGK